MENKLDEILKEIETKDLSFNQFEKYYNTMLSLLIKGYAKDACDLGYALYNACVVDSFDIKDKYEEYRRRIEIIVGEITRKYIEDRKVRVSKIFEDMKQRNETQSLSFEKYNYYVNLLKISYMAKLEDLDYLDIATYLQSILVNGVNTMENNVLYLKNLLMLESFVTELLEKEKTR